MVPGLTGGPPGTSEGTSVGTLTAQGTRRAHAPLACQSPEGHSQTSRRPARFPSVHTLPRAQWGPRGEALPTPVSSPLRAPACSGPLSSVVSAQGAPGSPRGRAGQPQTTAWTSLWTSPARALRCPTSRALNTHHSVYVLCCLVASGRGVRPSPPMPSRRFEKVHWMEWHRALLINELDRSFDFYTLTSILKLHVE